MKNRLTFPLALVVAAALSASPALAQKGGHGHGNGGGNGRGHGGGNTEHVRRDDRDDDDRDDHVIEQRRRTSDSYRRGDTYRSSNGTLRRRVPPGWCIGRGNPHNTVENCGRGANRYDRRYDPRYNGGYTYDQYGNRTSTYGGVYGGSNRDAFYAWKRQHDAQCRDLARQRPLDLRWQYQVRTQCAAEERDARRYYGV